MNTRILCWIAVSTLLLAVLAGAAVLYTGRHVVAVSMSPGTVAIVHLEVPMKRPGRPMSFAKRAGLPVACQPLDASSDAGLTCRVVETGHEVHKLWADVRIRAAPDAAPGRYRRAFDFEIDGEGEWPRAVVVVKVE